MVQYKFYTALAVAIVSMGLLWGALVLASYLRRVKRMRALANRILELPNPMPQDGATVPIWSAFWGSGNEAIVKNDKNPSMVLFEDHLEFTVTATRRYAFGDIERVDTIGAGLHLKFVIKKQGILGIYAPNPKVVSKILKLCKRKKIPLGRGAHDRLEGGG